MSSQVLGETEPGRPGDRSFCSVQNLLQLLQTLYAIMEQSTPSSFRNGEIKYEFDIFKIGTFWFFPDEVEIFLVNYLQYLLDDPLRG